MLAPIPSARTPTATSVNDGDAEQGRHGVAGVVDGVLDPPGAAVVAMPLLHLRDAAEGAAGLEPGGRRREAAGQRVTLSQLEMRRDLVVELAIEPVLPDQGEQSMEQPPRRHALASRMRATSAVACSHCATSSCSCLAPVLVSE